MTSTEQPHVTVLLFGHARELAGHETTSLSIGAATTVDDALTLLLERFPALDQLQAVLLTAVNENYALRSQRLEPGDVLAVFPPVSGGSGDFFEITREPIAIEEMRRRLLRGEDGAVVIFDGVARNNTRGRRTLYLEYEGYDDMAIRTMQQIGTEAHEKWPGIDGIGITHRLGRIEIGESSVVIVVTSPHRNVAFEAGRFAIDRLKQIVPIWKKEYFEDGAVWVQGEAWPDIPDSNSTT